MRLSIEMRARPEKSQELYQTLQGLLPAIRKDKKCRDCRVCRDLEDEKIFSLTVDWDSKASLDAFLLSESAGALLGAVDLLSETARVQLGEDAPSEGVEKLKRMRKKNPVEKERE